MSEQSAPRKGGLGLHSQLIHTLCRLREVEEWKPVLAELATASGIHLQPPGSALRAAARLAGDFTELESSRALPAVERRRKCTALVAELDREPWVEDFMQGLRVGFEMRDFLVR